MTRTRRATRAMLAALLWSATGATALACPICFRIEEGPVSRGVLAAVFVLMGVTVGVLGCFARFVVRLARTAEPGTRNSERGTWNAERGTDSV